MSGPNGDLPMPVEPGVGEEDDCFGEAEYAAINSMLDQINTCLDHLEEKNDHLHARLQELLESNRQTRVEFQQQQQQQQQQQEQEQEQQLREGPPATQPHS
ncbi:bublin coiled-coil protein isoform X1 [Antechinus flavipes]|uniref:bublin coiled-coil protein isoform X1 n=1 Tax=Antechinus flavipes TaxID=38775 RepID=UPI002235E3F2|nr:bublin coiled-coil protein isoform X1 [Antechinus flavipes]